MAVAPWLFLEAVALRRYYVAVVHWFYFVAVVRAPDAPAVRRIEGPAGAVVAECAIVVQRREQKEDHKEEQTEDMQGS